MVGDSLEKIFSSYCQHTFQIFEYINPAHSKKKMPNAQTSTTAFQRVTRSMVRKMNEIVGHIAVDTKPTVDVNMIDTIESTDKKRTEPLPVLSHRDVIDISISPETSSTLKAIGTPHPYKPPTIHTVKKGKGEICKRPSKYTKSTVCSVKKAKSVNFPKKYLSQTSGHRSNKARTSKKPCVLMMQSKYIPYSAPLAPLTSATIDRFLNPQPLSEESQKFLAKLVKGDETMLQILDYCASKPVIESMDLLTALATLICSRIEGVDPKTGVITDMQKLIDAVISRYVTPLPESCDTFCYDTDSDLLRDELKATIIGAGLVEIPKTSFAIAKNHSASTNEPEAPVYNEEQLQSIAEMATIHQRMIEAKRYMHAMEAEIEKLTLNFQREERSQLTVSVKPQYRDWGMTTMATSANQLYPGETKKAAPHSANIPLSVFIPYIQIEQVIFPSMSTTGTEIDLTKLCFGSSSGSNAIRQEVLGTYYQFEEPVHQRFGHMEFNGRIDMITDSLIVEFKATPHDEKHVVQLLIYMIIKNHRDGRLINFKTGLTLRVHIVDFDALKEDFIKACYVLPDDYLKINSDDKNE